MIGLTALRGATVDSGGLPFLPEETKFKKFFERFTAHPEDLGQETSELLRQDHGEGYG